MHSFYRGTFAGLVWSGFFLAAGSAAERNAPGIVPPGYRFANDKVKLASLENKGLKKKDVLPKSPIRFGRPRPAVVFGKSKQPGKAGSVSREKIAVTLLEEAGVARANTPVTFGFPLPLGAVFDLADVRVLDAGGKEIPAQFAATVCWPDASLKWVLIDFSAPLAARQERRFFVEFGHEIKRAPAASPLRVEESPATITVRTGPLQVVIDRRRFNIFRSVWFDADHNGRFAATEKIAASADDGVRLVDERGKLFTAAARPPEKMTVEERGPRKVVVRVEGKYAAADGETYMAYIVRLTFRAGSPVVTVALTHVNDYLETEFTDITSLTLPLEFTPGVTRTEVFRRRENGELGEAETAVGFSLFQHDEKTSFLTAAGKRKKHGRGAGIVRCRLAGGAVTVVMHEFWQRWPKGLAVAGKELALSLLPPQPDENYGRDLPHYLMFPFVSGKYRFKWGMAFTERISFDFSGRLPPAEFDADANLPVVAVIPATWYARTKALGPVAVPRGKQFAQWDEFIAKSFELHLKLKRSQREYGYFNYGDWYGERGRNWGNNEYDLAHGLFRLFVRTGRREYFRWALTAARHQADVDCVHAYPDPYYVGSNHQHSIGHTGTWSQRPKHATWTHKYDSHTSAGNGHTWAGGMMAAWYLTGDARIMEACIGLGEHITWAFAPSFNRLGSHERTAGWSLHAICAIYLGTYDPEYLAAAKRIAEIPLREQKFDQGGAWPHVLPPGHADGRRGVPGNNLFLIGVLLSGLKDYHEISGDPRVKKSLVAGARWMLKSWDQTGAGWPYSAGPNGERIYRQANAKMSPLIIPPLAYVAHLTNDDEMMRVVENALKAVLRQSPTPIGKNLAWRNHFAAEIMARLQAWYAASLDDKGLTKFDGSDTGWEQFLARIPDATGFFTRGPKEKIFFVRLLGSRGELRAERIPHGAIPQVDEFGTIRVLDARGKVVGEDKFSTTGRHQYRCPLQGQADAEFKVIVSDDMRAVWDLQGKGIKLVVKTVRDFHFGSIGRCRFYFFVPKDTREFKVRLVGVHRGEFGGAVFSPANKLAGAYAGAHYSQALLRNHPGVKPSTGEITVRPGAEDTGKIWSLVLYAAGNIRCELEGVPPYLALTSEQWFNPHADQP